MKIRDLTRSSLALALLVLGAAVSLIWLVHPYFDTRYNDASTYILTARAIVDGDGYSHLGSPFTLRPPGFSLLLAPVLALFGTNFFLLNLYVSSFGVLCVAMLFVYLKPHLGVLVAFATAATVWLNPSFQQLSTLVMSDVPGAALTLLCLNVARWAERKPESRRDLVVGLCLAGAAYVRSISLLLLPAILLSRLARRGRRASGGASPTRFVGRRAAVVVAVPLLALVPWSVRNAVQRPPPPAEQTLAYSYSTRIWHTDWGDPDSPTLTAGDILRRPPEQMRIVLARLGTRMGSSSQEPANLMLGTVGILCLLVTIVWRRGAGEIFACGGLALLAFLPALPPRLTLPVYLFAFPATVEILMRGLGKISPPAVGRLSTAVLVLLLGIVDFAPRARWPEIAERHKEIEELSDYLRARFDDDVPLAATLGWHLSVHLERPVYSLRWALIRDDLPGVLDVLEKHEIGAVAITPKSAKDHSLILALSDSSAVESHGEARILSVDAQAIAALQRTLQPSAGRRRGDPR